MLPARNWMRGSPTRHGARRYSGGRRPLGSRSANRSWGTGKGMIMTNADIVRALFDSYLSQDRDVAESLLSEHFVFTSPQDDHIGKAAFFERCFPTAERLREQKLLHVVPTEANDVFILYEYELRTGERHRNAEVLTVRDGKVIETQVFFGGRVS